MSKSVQEALKEAGRLIAVGVVALVISVLQEKVLPVVDQTSTVVVVGLLLKAADKLVHEIDKGKLKDVKGLVPF